MTIETATDTLQPIMDAAFSKYDENGSYNDFVGSLRGIERAVVLIGTLNYQVCNGGFVQWVDNGYALRAADVITALDALQTFAARRVRELVQTVIPEISLNRRGGYTLPDDVHFDAQDTEFYQLNETLLTDLVAWVQAEQARA